MYLFLVNWFLVLCFSVSWWLGNFCWVRKTQATSNTAISEQHKFPIWPAMMTSSGHWAQGEVGRSFIAEDQLCRWTSVILLRKICILKSIHIELFSYVQDSLHLLAVISILEWWLFEVPHNERGFALIFLL